MWSLHWINILNPWILESFLCAARIARIDTNNNTLPCMCYRNINVLYHLHELSDTLHSWKWDCLRWYINIIHESSKVYWYQYSGMAIPNILSSLNFTSDFCYRNYCYRTEIPARPVLIYCQLDTWEWTSIKIGPRYIYFSWMNPLENAV